MRSSRRNALFTILIGIVFASPFFAGSPVSADTILVPDDYDTIQGAIDEAVDGDTVEVAAGFYVENLDFGGKTLALIGVDGAEVTTINGSDETLGPDSASVIRLSGGELAGTVIEGFTLTGGSGSADTSSSGNTISLGGGIVAYDAEVEVIDCVISGNDNGGVHLDTATITLEGCTISGNADRGGVESYDGSTVTLIDCVIDDNVSTYFVGGVSTSAECTGSFTDCTISNNTGLLAGGMGVWGTGEIVGCTIVDNIGWAGGVAAVLDDADATLLITGCEFRSNVGSRGGGLHTGATLALDPGQARVEACLFVGNEGSIGGAIFGDGLGGPIEFDRCTVVDSLADTSGAIHIQSLATVELTFTNSIVWANGEEAITEGSGSIEISYSTVEDGYDGLGNLDGDPLFVDADNDDYRLTVLSPCIDAGDPLVLDPDGTVVDMGAFYFPAASQFMRGDVDGNGVTNALIDALFLLEWQFVSGESPPCEDAADVDDNGALLALTDALVLLQWGFTGGTTPPSPGPFDCGFDLTDENDELGCETEPDCG